MSTKIAGFLGGMMCAFVLLAVPTTADAECGCKGNVTKQGAPYKMWDKSGVFADDSSETTQKVITEYFNTTSADGILTRSETPDSEGVTTGKGIDAASPMNDKADYLEVVRQEAYVYRPCDVAAGDFMVRVQHSKYSTAWSAIASDRTATAADKVIETVIDDVAGSDPNPSSSEPVAVTGDYAHVVQLLADEGVKASLKIQTSSDKGKTWDDVAAECVSQEVVSGTSKTAAGNTSATASESEDDDIEDKECGAEIGNQIWNDLNRDGIQQDSEPGIEDIRVKLRWAGSDNKFDNDDAYLRTDTNSKGRYHFEDLPKGKYRVIVKEEDIAKYNLVQTYDPTGSTMNNEASVKVACGDDHTKADFGYYVGTQQGVVVPFSGKLSQTGFRVMESVVNTAQNIVEVLGGLTKN